MTDNPMHTNAPPPTIRVDHEATAQAVPMRQTSYTNPDYVGPGANAIAETVIDAAAGPGGNGGNGNGVGAASPLKVVVQPVVGVEIPAAAALVSPTAQAVA